MVWDIGRALKKATTFLQSIDETESVHSKNLQHTSTDQNKISDGKSTRIIDRIKNEIDQLLAQGHTDRLEQYIALLHLSYTHMDTLNAQDQAEMFDEISSILEKCHAIGKNDEHDAIDSQVPATVIYSYPRSGNTISVRLAARALQAQSFEAMPGSIIPFSKKIYPKNYPYIRLIKDHVARPIYKNDRVAIIVRDGRDCMISLAYMNFKNGSSKFENRGELAQFIRWLDDEYPFGGWAKFMSDAANLNRHEDKHVVRYEAFVANQNAFLDLIRYLDPDHCLPEEYLTRIYNIRDNIFENIKNTPRANESWGIGKQFGADSLFYEWSNNRQGSSWRESWDGEAKRAFHETGATDFLIDYGYETDSDWWRQ